MSLNLLQIIVYYPLITIIIWIPRTIFRIDTINNQNSFFSLYSLVLAVLIQGICYTIVFIIQEKSLNLFELSFLTEINSIENNETRISNSSNISLSINSNLSMTIMNVLLESSNLNNIQSLDGNNIQSSEINKTHARDSNL